MEENYLQFQSAQDGYISVVVNLKNLRFMTLVKANLLISDLKKEVENTIAKLCSVKVKIKTLKNSVNAILPAWYPVAPLVKNGDEIFAFTADNFTTKLYSAVSPSVSVALPDSGFTSPVMKPGTSEKPEEDMGLPEHMRINEDQEEGQGKMNQHLEANLNQDEGNEVLSEIFSLKGYQTTANCLLPEPINSQKGRNDLGNKERVMRESVDDTQAQKEIDKAVLSGKEKDSESSSDESSLDESAKKAKNTKKLSQEKKPQVQSQKTEKVSQKKPVQRKNTSNMKSGQGSDDTTSDDSTDDERMEVDTKHENKNRDVKTNEHSLKKSGNLSPVSVQKEQFLSGGKMKVDVEKVDKENKESEKHSAAVSKEASKNGKAKSAANTGRQESVSSDESSENDDNNKAKDTLESNRKKELNCGDQSKNKKGKTIVTKTSDKPSARSSNKSKITPASVPADKKDVQESSSDDESSTDSGNQEGKTTGEKGGMSGGNTKGGKNDVKNSNKVGKNNTKMLDTKSTSGTTKKDQSIEKKDSSSSDSSSSSESEIVEHSGKTSKKPNDATRTQQGVYVKNDISSEKNHNVSKNGKKGKDISQKTTANKTENNQEKSLGKEDENEAAMKAGVEKENDLSSLSDSSWSSSNEHDVETTNRKTLKNKTETRTVSTKDGKSTLKPTKSGSKSDMECMNKVKAKPKDAVKGASSPAKSVGHKKSKETASKNNAAAESESISDEEDVLKNGGDVLKDDKKKGDQSQPNDPNTSLSLPRTPPTSTPRRKSAVDLSASKVASWLLANPVSENGAEVSSSETGTTKKSKSRSKKKAGESIAIVDSTTDKIENTKSLVSPQDASQSAQKRTLEDDTEQESNKPKKDKKSKSSEKEKKTSEEDKQEKASAKRPMMANKGKNTSLSLPKISKGLSALLDDVSECSTKRSKKLRKQKLATPTVSGLKTSSGFLTPSSTVGRKSTGKSTKSRMKRISSSQPTKTVEMNSKEKEILDSGALNLETLLNDESIKW